MNVSNAARIRTLSPCSLLSRVMAPKPNSIDVRIWRLEQCAVCVFRQSWHERIVIAQYPESPARMM